MPKKIINGYEIIAHWNFCGNGKYSFARKGGEEFFIKELVSPRYPLSGSESVRRERIKECEEFEKSRKQVMDALKKRHCQMEIYCILSNFFEMVHFTMKLVIGLTVKILISQ